MTRNGKICIFFENYIKIFLIQINEKCSEYAVYGVESHDQFLSTIATPA